MRHERGGGRDGRSGDRWGSNGTAEVIHQYGLEFMLAAIRTGRSLTVVDHLLAGIRNLM